ncbi:MAG: tRNA uridine-5-carboxymethylaminomethyl(34) synthesis GTPase MnmE [Nitrospinaceae bacterium]|nr:tRNA uridine-5-carboxymethylaminomethyl(34) synthesis GTPase MnmE [Nitrospinaceae bacterium]
MNFHSDTIAAIATPVGEGSVSIIRISGQGALPIASKLFRSPNGESVGEITPHRVHFGIIHDPANGQCIDEVLLTWFKAPKSFTAEDVVEISAHGGLFVSSRILGLILDQGAHPAEPGEFTRRAFTNGRIDLSQAEAVADLIAAASERALQSAIGQLKGQLSEQLNGLYDRLLSILSQIEAAIDFPEEDLDFEESDRSENEIRSIREEVDALIRTYRQGKIFREGVSVALVGKPNVGKSSLLNALLQEDRAIVTPHPGTTRDTIEERVRIRDIHINIIDSAGLRSHPETIEEEGIRRTRSAVERADLVLVIFDRSQPLDANDDLMHREVGDKTKLIIVNKCDLREDWPASVLKEKFPDAEPILISAKVARGLDTLVDSIHSHILEGPAPGEGIFITRERHRTHLAQASEALKKTLDSLEQKLSEEFVATDLTIAMNHLGAILGKTIEDDLLDQIFSTFCIGK